MDAAGAAAGTEFARDTSAGFTLTVGAKDMDTTGFTPYAVSVGKGFRRVIDEPNGNPRAILLVALPAKAGQRGHTFVRVTGDPSRADSLLKAAKLQ